MNESSVARDKSEYVGRSVNEKEKTWIKSFPVPYKGVSACAVCEMIKADTWKHSPHKNDNLFFNHTRKIYEWVKQIALGASKRSQNCLARCIVSATCVRHSPQKRANNIWQHHLNNFDSTNSQREIKYEPHFVKLHDKRLFEEVWCGGWGEKHVGWFNGF